VKGDALLPLILNFTLGYAIMKVQENQVELELNGTHHHLLVYSDDVNLLGKNINTIKKIHKNSYVLVRRLITKM
jgi:hypothetical protein